MPIISFKTLSASLTEEYGDDSGEPVKSPTFQFKPARSHRLAYRLSLDHGEDIELSTGEKFRQLTGHLGIRPFAKAGSIEQKCIGIFYYFGESGSDIDFHPAVYGADVALPEDQFAELVSAAKSGRIPTYVSMNVRGMDYGWDDSIKKWDNKISPHLEIDKITISTQFACVQDLLNEDDEVDNNFLPVTRGQAKQAIDNLTAVQKQLDRVIKTMSSILLALMAIALLIFIFRYTR